MALTLNVKDRYAYDLSCRLHLAIDHQKLSLSDVLMVVADFIAHRAQTVGDNPAGDMHKAAREIAHIAQHLD